MNAAVDQRLENKSILLVTSHRPKEVTEPFSRMQVRTETLTIDADTGPLERSIRAARQSSRAIRTHTPDLLFLDCFETIGAPVTLVAQQNDVPVVARLVGDPWRKLREERLLPARNDRDIPRYFRHQLSHRLNEYIFSRVDGFVVVSTDLVDAVRRNTDCPRERIGVVPVPISSDTVTGGSPNQPRERFGITERQVILTVTNLKFRAKRRGVEKIVSEMLPLLRENEDLAYVIAGGGGQHQKLIDWLDETIDDPSLRNRIYPLGYISEVSDLYALADVFVYVSSLDGYPNVVLEAQSAGLPVVANDAHGMRDQITDGETGFLVDPGDTGSLRERVSLLLQDVELRERVGEQAKERVLAENSHDAVARKYSDVLDKLFSEING